jgi:peptidoglycan-N-acetylglucosamine deacetylase
MKAQRSSGIARPAFSDRPNLLTFDIEDWYHVNYPVIDFTLYDPREDHQTLLDHTRQIVRYCVDRGLQGTFFVLGRLLEKKPEIGRVIVEGGQELALHGYEHDLLTGQTSERFKQDLERSIKAFRRITGVLPLGFRAPSWSVDERNLWVLETLESFGFTYDSSIFPVKNFLYGLTDAPIEPFYPVIGERALRLLEVPVTVLKVGARRLAYSGGIYFNLWPFRIIQKMSESKSRQGRFTLFYFHPWDLWKRSAAHRRRLKAHWTALHLGNTLNKFERLLDTFPLTSIADRLDTLQAEARPFPLGNAHGL